MRLELANAILYMQQQQGWIPLGRVTHVRLTTLSAATDFYAGGPGSGCNPAVGKCGRPDEGKTSQPKPKGWRKFNPHNVGGYFRRGTTIAQMYRTLADKQGEWHSIKEFETEHAGKANISNRIQELKYTGKRSGLWAVEQSGDQVRMFLISKLALTKMQGLTDEQLAIANKLAQDVIAMQGKGTPTWTSAPEDWKALFDKYYQDMGVSAESKKMLESSIDGWVGTVNGDSAQALRAVAMGYYGREAADEHTDGITNLIEAKDPGLLQRAQIMQPAALALKAYTAAYMTQTGLTEVYRGVGGGPASDIVGALKEGASELPVPVNSLSSWSVSKAQAIKFADKTYTSTVLRMRVDPENIWASQAATPWLFGSFKHEQEVIVGVRNPKEIFKPSDVMNKKGGEWGWAG